MNRIKCLLITDKREIEQSEARDKLAKVLAGMGPLGSSAYEFITTIVVPLHEKEKRGIAL